MFTLPNVDEKLQGNIREKIEVLDDFSMAHFLKEDNIKQGKWKNVYRVSMRNSQVSNKAIKLLCNHPVSEQIEHLELQDNYSSINDETMEIISNSIYMTNLKHLDLSDSEVSDDGMGSLVMSKVSQNLTTLILYGNVQVSSEFFKHLANSKECRSLQQLDLRATYVNDFGFKEYFSTSTNFQNIKILNLSMNVEAITDETLISLSVSKRIKQLEVLHIANCMITDSGIDAICKSQNFSKLTDLDISKDNKDFKLNNITDKSLEYLSDTTFISELTKLNLRGLKITSFGIQCLTRSYNFQNLQYLRLSQNIGISDLAIEHFVNYIKNLKNLNKLYLNDTGTTREGIKQLLKQLPKIDVIYDNTHYIDIHEEEKAEQAQQAQQKQQPKANVITLLGSKK